MIAFYAQGGLGNQLFQYAAAKSSAAALGCEVVVDPYWFDHPNAGETPRELELEKFRLDLRVATKDEQRRWRLMHRRYARLIKPLLPLKLVDERWHPAMPADAGSYLKGYWQSEQYFQQLRPQLLEEIVPRQAASEDDHAVLARIKASTAISVHIRRGDYVSLQSAASFHGVCSLDYYRRAISYLCERVSAANFFIFSDDPAWAKANLELPGSSHFVDHNNAANAFQDLRLMQHCQHHIIANSSFSWWGAWLADNTDQIVVAPKQWFATSATPDDLLPPRWHQL